MPVQKTTKDQIIIKSIEVFLKQGYYNTSMSDLAEACGLQKGSFYYHFKSKEELMQTVLKMAHSYYKKKVFSIAYQDGLTAEDRLIQMFKKQEPMITNDMSGCLFGNMTLESISNKVEFKDLLKAFFSDWISAFKYIFQEKHNDKVAYALAKQSVMEIEGALMMMRLYDDMKLLEMACLRVVARLKNESL
ncbi:MAG: TetR/AcrR family transcriptional regulator [Saprospiraceae bacterium]|nr:TetR/AcrR family transcriptional regulator [Saprospiraceae bacterium]